MSAPASFWDGLVDPEVPAPAGASSEVTPAAPVASAESPDTGETPAPPLSFFDSLPDAESPDAGVSSSLPEAGGTPSPLKAPAPGSTTPVPSGTALKGAGWAKWSTTTEGDDIVANGNATVFGGGKDPGDNSKGIGGLAVGPDTLGVSLPTGQNMGTDGSPFPSLPPGTMVQVTNPKTGQTITVPVIDEGPVLTDDAGIGIGQSMVDLSPATARALGLNDSPKDADPAGVQIRILGGAKYVGPEQVQGDAASGAGFNKGDLSVVQGLGKAIFGGPNIDVNAVDDLAGRVKSGPLLSLARLLGGYADNLQNNNGDEDLNTTATAGIKKTYNQLHSLFATLAGRKS